MDCTDDGDGGWGGRGRGGRCNWLGRPTDFRDDSGLYRRWRWEVGGGG